MKKLKKFASHAPMNCLHKYLLVKAEVANLEGNDLQALKYYEESTIHAQNNYFVSEEAISYELTAKYFISKGMNNFAKSYLLEAQRKYSDWGSNAKVNNINQNYPELLIPISKRKNTTPVNSLQYVRIFDSSLGDVSLDFSTMIKNYILKQGA